MKYKVKPVTKAQMHEAKISFLREVTGCGCSQCSCTDYDKVNFKPNEVMLVVEPADKAGGFTIKKKAYKREKAAKRWAWDK